MRLHGARRSQFLAAICCRDNDPIREREAYVATGTTSDLHRIFRVFLQLLRLHAV